MTGGIWREESDVVLLSRKYASTTCFRKDGIVPQILPSLDYIKASTPTKKKQLCSLRVP